MADIVDTANDYAEEERALAIRNIRARQGAGSSECIKCDEPISDLRQELGATLCIYCQEEQERKANGY